jgi:adenine-specific DNA methylase
VQNPNGARPESAVVDLNEFPSTRYQGSKRKITPWIWAQLQELDFSSALDIFGGTASVSYLLKKMGKQVTYNDYLHLRSTHLKIRSIDSFKVRSKASTLLIAKMPG